MDAQQLDPIARRHGLALVVQFGSSVRGQTHVHSDCDIGVLFERVPDDIGAVGDVTADLQPLSPGREVDVAVLNHADPLFLNQVMESARLLFGSERRFHELRLKAFKQYQDHRPYLALERAYVARKAGSTRP